MTPAEQKLLDQYIALHKRAAMLVSEASDLSAIDKADLFLCAFLITLKKSIPEATITHLAQQLKGHPIFTITALGLETTRKHWENI